MHIGLLLGTIEVAVGMMDLSTEHKVVERRFILMSKISFGFSSLRFFFTFIQR